MKHTARRQVGFSLVELMVAMVVALILLAGILQILLGNRESFAVQQANAELQENARLVSFVIENVVAHAGYRVNLAAPDKIIFPAHVEDSDLPIARGAFVASNDGGDNGNDAVRLRFQANGGVHDCAGKKVGSLADTGKLSDFALYVNAEDKLVCKIYGKSHDGTYKVVRYASLVRNVERFKVTYGIDSDDDNAVDTYVDTVDASSALQVRSLRLQLLLRSQDNVLPSGVQRTYAFADGSDETTDADDRHARQLVDQTVALRNVLP